MIITCSCLYLFSTKPVNWGGLLFISMSIFHKLDAKLYNVKQIHNAAKTEVFFIKKKKDHAMQVCVCFVCGGACMHVCLWGEGGTFLLNGSCHLQKKIMTRRAWL